MRRVSTVAARCWSGGDAHGANAAVQNAQQTFVSSDATIKADAMQRGDGGKVVVWADGATQFNGNISARGGSISGNGGWVEVSGKQWLGYTGLVNTTAAHGLTGSLLLDPTDITIGVAPDTTTMTCTIAGVCTDVTTTPSNLNITTLVTQLGSSNVTVDTTSALGGGVGNITIADSLVYSSPNTLTLNAAGTGFILVNTNTSNLTAVIPLQISVSGGGSLLMQTAGGSIGIGAAGGVNITGGGSFTANAGGATSDLIFSSAINTGTGAINLTAGQSVTELRGWQSYHDRAADNQIGWRYHFEWRQCCGQLCGNEHGKWKHRTDQYVFESGAGWYKPNRRWRGDGDQHRQHQPRRER